jgi:hypothetical protein
MDDYGASVLAARVRGKTRRMLMKAPLVNQWSQYRYLAQLGRHAGNLPWLGRDSFDLLAEVREHGVAVRNATTMIPAGVLEVADRFLDELRISTEQDCTVSIPPDHLADHPAVYKWGLNDDNLDLAECYIGLPVHYLGPGVKRERADGAAAYARQWHLDVEDRRLLKIIVYLSDVIEGCGPFEYINREWSAQAARALRYKSGYIADSAMARVVPAQEWVQVTGPRLTAIFVDTTRVFHRAKPPTAVDRYSMTFTYSSTTPYQTFPEWMLSQASLTALGAELMPRQRRAAMAE